MLFQKNMINYIDQEIKSWEEGIQLGSQILIDQQYVNQSYVEEVIQITNQQGPYYIIAPHIALLHVAPKQGTKDNAISFTYFKNPIIFKKDVHYHVNFCLALLTKDNNSHLDILQKVAMLFVNQEFLDQLSNCQSKKEVFKVLKKYDS